MADLGGGVYVSRVDTDEFDADEEVGGFTHTLFEDGERRRRGCGSRAPMSATGRRPGSFRHARRSSSSSGSVRIEIEDGPTLDLGVGDMASMPKGAVTTWYPSADFKEIWFYS